MNLTTENLNIMAGISHEIRNPVNAIIGISHLLQNENQKDVQEELIRVLLETSERLRELTNNILDFTKLEEGRVPRRVAPVDIKKELPAFLYGQETVARAKGLDFVIDIAENVPPLVVFDKVRGMQILINLTSNAVKFTQEGEIRVVVKALKISNKEVNLHFGVNDTGLGIPEEKQEQIFEPFRQGGRSVNLKHGGTGLGLSIADMLVADAGGELNLKSKVGEGSEFFFVVWLGMLEKAEPELSEVKAVPLKELLRNRKILIVDDNKINLMIAGKTFKNWEVAFSTAHNGIEAVAKVQEEDFAAVLMDLHMPKMDGYEATCAIRNLEGDKFLSLPIIALSGSTGFSKMEEVKATGFTEFLSKPYKPQELMEKIVEVVKIGEMLID